MTRGTSFALALALLSATMPQAAAGFSPGRSGTRVTTEQKTEKNTERATDRTTSRGWQFIAHRGGMVWGPEHTLPTFDHALGLGVDGVEIDVRFTRDRIPVVFHDADLERTTDCTGRIAARTLAKLAGCDAGSWFDPDFTGARIQPLDDTLAHLQAGSPELHVFLHMKRFGRSHVAAVMATLQRSGLPDHRVTVVCNTEECLQRFDRAGAPRLAFTFRPSDDWKNSSPVLIPYLTPITRELIAAAHRRGQLVLAVEDKPYSVRELLALGVDGVLANDVERAAALR